MTSACPCVDWLMMMMVLLLLFLLVMIDACAPLLMGTAASSHCPQCLTQATPRPSLPPLLHQRLLQHQRLLHQFEYGDVPWWLCGYVPALHTLP